MSIDWETIRTTLVAAVPGVVAVLGYLSGPGALRSRLRHDVDLLDKLPEGSDAHNKLLAHIASQLDRITKLDTEASRDISGAIIAIGMSIGFGWLAAWLVGLDDWWSKILGGFAAVLAIAGLAYLFDTLQRVPRNEKGNRI